MSIGWDELVKMIVRANPQDFVSLLTQNTQFQHDISQELIVRTVKADFLCKALKNNQEVVIHVEFQRKKHAKMPRRVWEYNCATAYLTKLPVCSYVIYLWKVGNIVEPPYRVILDDGQLIHVFYYENIFLWEVPPEVLKQKGLEGLLPLLPLTKGADEARDEVVDDMIKGLQAARKEDMLALGYAIAGRVYQSEDDQHWLKRRFEMLGDLFEDSWSYREIVQKGINKGMEMGMEKGMEKGINQGLEKGINQGLEKGINQGLEALRPLLVRVAETRFPELVPLARQQAQQITTPAQLSAVIDELLVAQTPEKARQVLTNGGSPPNSPS